MSVDQAYFDDGRVLKPTWRTYVAHSLLLATTFCTATIAGILFPFGPIGTMPGPETDPQTFAQWIDFLFSLPTRYVILIGDSIVKLFTVPGYLTYGLSFSLSLLFILTAHEMGHYVACRIYKVDATLPFFIPTPPMVGPAGTFGAFIKIMSPLPTRKVIFDIGVAGPIAGFVALIPIAVAGLVTMPYFNSSHYGIEFSNPLLLRIGQQIIGNEIVPGMGNPFYFAAWVGLLVTALNLIPSGQLDGGHTLYAVFGERVHWWTGRIAFLVMASLSIVGWFVYGSPSGFLIAVLLGIMMRIKHPQPWDETPLDGKRKLIAVLTLLIFILCFVPFPLQLN